MNEYDLYTREENGRFIVGVPIAGENLEGSGDDLPESRIGGAALTERQCGLCTVTVHCGNTAIDSLCLACAQANELCKHCGSDIKLRLKRKLPVAAPEPEVARQ